MDQNIGQITFLDISEGRTLIDMFRPYCKDESGATAIKYGLICMVLLSLFSFLGTGGAGDVYYDNLAPEMGAAYSGDRALTWWAIDQNPRLDKWRKLPHRLPADTRTGS